jgi:hypothetical protein
MTIEAMKQALEALENLQGLCSEEGNFIEQLTIWTPEAMYALRNAIEAAEKPEPVAWMIEWNGEPTGDLFRHKGYATREMQRLNMLRPQDRRRLVPLFTAPPQRKPLTDEEIMDNWLKVMWAVGDKNKLPIPEFARAIEAAHGIK